METTKKNFSRVSGIIILVCTLGITILKISQGQDMESYFMPFFLLMMGLMFTFRKATGAEKQPELRMRRPKLVIAALSISLIAGIVVLIITIF